MQTLAERRRGSQRKAAHVPLALAQRLRTGTFDLQAELSHKPGLFSHRVCSVSVDGPGLGLFYLFAYSHRLAFSALSFRTYFLFSFKEKCTFAQQVYAGAEN